MYILILEDGRIRKSAKVTEDDKEASEYTALELIDISDPARPKEYFFGAWIEIGDRYETVNQP